MSAVGTIHAKMRSLESTWRDQEQRKFAESFTDTVRVLARFVDASEQHVVFLNKKAQLAEEYLKRR